MLLGPSHSSPMHAARIPAMWSLEIRIARTFQFMFLASLSNFKRWHKVKLVIGGIGPAELDVSRWLVRAHLYRKRRKRGLRRTLRNLRLRTLPRTLLPFFFMLFRLVSKITPYSKHISFT